jgi:hydroxymethylpyrimidine/phosphomethylpyrimidine kinase
VNARRAVLVIAATDSSGGAGVTRDVETLTELGTPARCAVTAVTVQTDAQVRAIHALPAELVRAQIVAALEGGGIGAVKIGMLASAAAVRAVAEALPSRALVPIVLDPVLAASAGGALLDSEGVALLRSLLAPRVTLLTPNLPEAAALLAQAPATSEAMQIAQLRALLALGPMAVLLKGGHPTETADRVTDRLLIARADSGARPVADSSAADEVIRFEVPRVPAQRRGTGCSASSAIAAHLAAGESLTQACAAAQEYVAAALRRRGAPELALIGAA